MSSVAGALPVQLAGLIVQLCSQLCRLHTCYNLAHLSGLCSHASSPQGILSEA